MSSGSDTDDDYVPGKQEQLSEDETADEETEEQYEAEVDHRNKRKSIKAQQNGKRRKLKKVENKDNDDETAAKHEDTQLDAEEEKKKEDALWASFLGDTTNRTPKSTPQELKDTPKETNDVGMEPKKSSANKEAKDDAKDKEARIFEFAGEKVIVENNVIKEVVKVTPSTSPLASVNVCPVRRSGGLGGLVSQLNKKNKLSTLEKTKLDWDTFKKKEGIEEELQSHNKGKEGYLDKQDFLERADLRQFELERDLRTGRRSDR